MRRPRLWCLGALILVASFTSPTDAHAAIRRIQRVTASSSGTSPNTVSITWAQPTAPKNLLVCVVGMNDSAATVTTYPTGFVSAVKGIYPSRNSVEIYYYAAAPAQAGTQSWIVTGGYPEATVTCMEYAGAQFTPLDKTGTLTNGTGTSASVATSAPTTHAAGLAVAAFNNDDKISHPTWGNSFNELADFQPISPTNQPPYTGVADRLLTSTGTITATATLAGTGASAISGAIATFKAETSTTRYWRCSIQSDFDDNTCWSSTNGISTNDVPAPDISGTMTAIFNGTGTGDAIIRFDPNLLSLQLNSGYTGTVRQMTGGTQGLVGDWYDGMNFDTYKGTYIDGPISFLNLSGWDTSYGGPRTGSTDGSTFSVRWTGQVYAPVSGSYVFRGFTDDGVRLWVNGTQLINNWTNKGASESVGSSISLTAGTWYDITLEYYESTGGNDCELRWTHPSQGSSIMVPAAYLRTKGGTGLQTDWYDGINGISLPAAAANFKHRSLTSNVDYVVASEWKSKVASMITDSYDGDSYSVAWQGQVLAAYSETYTFSAFADDGVRVWVDGQMVIDSWIAQYATIVGSPTIAMTAGQWYDVRVEYFEGAVAGDIQLRYQSASQPLATIPSSALRSAAALTVGSFTQAAGSFVGGSGTMDVNGAFSATGGSFTAPARLEVGGAMTTAGSTFVHNSGRVVLDATSNVALNPGATNTYNALHVNSSLVAYWNFDETSTSSSSSAADLSGYGHTAYHVNTPAASTTLPSLNFSNTRSLQFTTASRHALRLPLTPELQPTINLTVAFWYKATQTDASGSDVVSAGDNWVVRLYGHQTHFIHRASGVAVACIMSRTSTDNVWHHVAITHSSSSGTLIYIDGVVGQTCNGASDTVVLGYDRGRELWIGRNGAGGTEADYDGHLDELRIYNASLSNAEIAALANGNASAPSAVTYTLASHLTMAGELYLNSGTLDASSTPYNITTADDWISNGGAFTARTGTVTLSAITTGKIVTTAASPFYNLTASGSGGGWTLGDRLVATGTFTQSAGTFGVGASGYPMTVANFSQTAGTFTPETGTVTITGSSTQTLRAASSLYALGIQNPQESGLLAYWKLDDRPGSSIADSSGNGNTGTLMGSPAIWSGQKATTTFHNPSSMRFSGTNYVSVPSSTTLNQATAALSISAWVHDTSGNWASNNRRVLEKGSESQFSMMAELGVAVCRAYIAGTKRSSTKALPTSNAWHHWACVYDGATLTIYIDGVAGTPVSATGSVATTSTSLDIGNKPGSAGAGEYFIGYIDDVRLYSTALSTKQLAGLYAGRYPSGTSTNATTLGAALTVTNSLAIESGRLSTSTYAVSSGSSNVLAVNAGTLLIGTGSVTASGGLTVKPTGTLEMPSTTTLNIGSGKTLTLDGAFTKAAGSIPTIQSVSGTYALTVNSDTANPYATLNIDGLNVKNTDTNGFNVAKATSSTFVKFQNINFSNGTGARLLYINGNDLDLNAPGCTFDLGAGARTTTNNVVVAGTGSRYQFENRGTSTNGIGVGEDHDSDNDNDSAVNGIPDNGGSVVQWLWGAKTDLAGSIVGFPTPAFNWSNFTYYATYVAMKNVDGTTDRVYVRTVNGDASYSWDLPPGVGDIASTPRWDVVSNVKYLFVSTTGGYIYKLVDSGSALDLAPDPWNTPYNQGANATVTSGLLSDTNYLYWAGNNTSGNPTLFRLSNVSKGTATTQSLTATVNAAMALDNPSASAYVMAATAGHFYRYDATSNTAPTDSTTLAPAAIDGRILVLHNRLYAVDNAGKLTVAPTTTLGTATWTYQDIPTHTSCSSGNNCEAKNLYVNVDEYLITGGTAKPRVAFGDKDGHVYVVRQNGATTSGVAMTGYPLQPNSDTSPIVASPLYHLGILLVGNSNGKVYVLNAFTATGPATPAILQMYDFGAGVTIASISRNHATNSNAGAYMVGTSDGKLFYINTRTDPDSYQ